MKYNRKNELDVDFIGGQEPLTNEEETAINDYLKAKKTSTEKLLPVKRKRQVKQKRYSA